MSFWILIVKSAFTAFQSIPSSGVILHRDPTHQKTDFPGRRIDRNNFHPELDGIHGDLFDKVSAVANMELCVNRHLKWLSRAGQVKRSIVTLAEVRVELDNRSSSYLRRGDYVRPNRDIEAFPFFCNWSTKVIQ